MPHLAEVAEGLAVPEPNPKNEAGPGRFPPSRGPPISFFYVLRPEAAPYARGALPSFLAGPDNEPPQSIRRPAAKRAGAYQT